MVQPPLPTLVDQLKALSSPYRLRILAMLREGELCVCEMTDVVGLAPSTVSQYLSDLRKAGFVTDRKVGHWVHYALAHEAFPVAVLGVLWPRLSEDPTIASDRRSALEARTRLPRACSIEPESKDSPACAACERAGGPLLHI